MAKIESLVMRRRIIKELKVSFPKSFTLLELVVVIAIIAILAAIIAPNAFKAIEKAKISRAMADAKALRVGSEGYYADIGFFPPDTCRGDDPGFMKSLPYNPDSGGSPHCLSTTGLPSNWQSIVQIYWDGPYLERWPNLTPWAGKYDWNYWPSGATRYGVNIPPGCYVGVQRDYSDHNPIPASSEQIMVDKGFDIDGHVNGEAQLFIRRF